MQGTKSCWRKGIDQETLLGDATLANYGIYYVLALSMKCMTELYCQIVVIKSPDQ